jgi:hypothetical protein
MERMEQRWMTTEFWVQMIVYALSMGSFAGTILTRIRFLEKKMDKHNGLLERMVAVEQSAKSAHHRLDKI